MSVSATVDGRADLRTSEAEVRLVGELVRRVAADLAMITERDVRVLACHVERARERAVGAGGVHISFKQTYQRGDRIDQGCLLVPLADALSVAGYFLMLPDDVVAQQRASTSVDAQTKEALLEVASFVAGSLQGALASGTAVGIQVRSASCQGVRADTPPALSLEPGGELWIARAKLQVHTFAASDVLLMVPCFAGVDSDPVAGAPVSQP